MGASAPTAAAHQAYRSNVNSHRRSVEKCSALSVPHPREAQVQKLRSSSVPGIMFTAGEALSC
eukprot:9992224-Heterocapsa_arctica.AAC.1